MRRAASRGSRIDSVLLIACVLLALILKASSDQMREGVAGALRHTILAPAFSLQATIERTRSAVASHDELIRSRDSTLVKIAELRPLELENDNLRALLMLGARLNWGFVPAIVMHEIALGSGTTLMLSAGEAEGVQRLAPVVTADGLVGIILSVDRHSSIVGLWTDPNFSVSAMPEDGSAFGIIAPRLTAGGSADRNLLELRNVGFRSSLKPGTRIVATGTGGVFPAMVPIGTIVSELETSTGWSRTYLVRPAVLPQDLSAVLILEPQRGRESVASAWPSSDSRDSVLQALVQKGDSLARFEYARQLKAAADSELARLRTIDTSAVPTRVDSGTAGGAAAGAAGGGGGGGGAGEGGADGQE